MEIQNKPTVTRGEGERDNGKEGGGSSQGTCVKDPWTKTMGGGLRVEDGRRVGQGRVMREKWGQL